ncbi:cytidine deaminase [Ureaplasma sp. ES3154-GEN]|uniref:cytidine deaminase n=1 Tax=Ureaplasma sp. ES3154-GEN TaxID=2984844 RepID=UPI0021E72859|nr:cytidine deaminase [Ureaplasma sp. ES3154-GEN]MCV3743668.1 cytidine deaminase [Ureaplasma sp. ES3154-GEN]
MKTKINYENIYQQLKTLQKRSYAPYSHYPVAALALSNDTFIPGVNVENGSYGLTVCAERNAIFSMIALGYQKLDMMFLITNDENDSGTPCGACRQVISEFMQLDGSVVVYNQSGTYKIYQLQELLPHSWSPTASLK